MFRSWVSDFGSKLSFLFTAEERGFGGFGGGFLGFWEEKLLGGFGGGFGSLNGVF